MYPTDICDYLIFMARNSRIIKKELILNVRASPIFLKTMRTKKSL